MAKPPFQPKIVMPIRAKGKAQILSLMWWTAPAPDNEFAAWIGIVPRQESTGGKQKLGPISKRGDQYLRRVLVVGAHAVLKRARHQPEKYPWVTRLLERKPFRVVAAAVANKMARVAWALLVRGAAIGRLRLRQRRKGDGESRVSLRLCAYELQG
jgi:hypothetical protein